MINSFFKDKLTTKRAWIALLLLPVLHSCATYNNAMDSYYSNIRSHNYDKALEKLDGNKLMQHDRNQLLFLMEKGSVYRFKNDYVASNNYFNQADNYIENSKKSVSDVIVGNLLNPMQTAYRGEDFEQFMVHYYKALNYAALGQNDEALVEARRITLSNNTQGDKFKNKDARYSTDAFALNLQGIIYELGNDINNAFIAYRNAADLYLVNNNSYYGVTLPNQLKKDLLRTATLMGFNSEADKYNKLFNMPYTPSDNQNGELVLFLEEGEAPQKQENNFVLTSVAGQVGSFSFVNLEGNSVTIPFDYAAYNISQNKLSSVRTIRIAVPVYRVVYPQLAGCTILSNNVSYPVELAQNINSVAINVLKERFLTEIANALARQLTKQLMQAGTKAATEGIAKSAEKTDDKKKKEDNAKAAGEVAGFLVNIVNTLTEKADTRNWQSLPAFVSYVRIPLVAGENTINITSRGKVKTIKIDGQKGIQMRAALLD